MNVTSTDIHALTNEKAMIIVAALFRMKELIKADEIRFQLTDENGIEIVSHWWSLDWHSKVFISLADLENDNTPRLVRIASEIRGQYLRKFSKVNQENSSVS